MGDRGSGRIYVRGTALWIYWHQGGDRREAVGKLAGKPSHKTTWADAVAVLETRLAQKRLGVNEALERGSILPAKQRKVTVAEIITAYEAKKLIEGVKRPVAFKGTCRALTAWWGHLPATSLTTEILEAEVKQRLDAGQARGTIKTRLRGLYAALRAAGDRIPRIPLAPALSVPLTRKGTWSGAELEAFCNVAKPWLADVARFGYLTGWRISECLGLTWDRVDPTRGLLFLDETKTDDPRVRPIEPAMTELLTRRRAARRLGCALVFHVDGLPVGDDRFYRAWKSALAQAELPGKLFHDLRRTAYDTLLLAGVDLFTAMEMVGHKSLSSARRYARQNVGRMRGALDKVEATRTASAGSARSVGAISR